MVMFLILGTLLGTLGTLYWLLSLFTPQKSVWVRLQFILTTTPGKFTFSWDKQTISICEYERRGLHRLWEWVQIPRKRCNVTINAGAQEFDNVPLGRTWFNWVHVGGKIVQFERSRPELMRHSNVGINWTIPTYAESSISFDMPDWNPTQGQKVKVNGRPLPAPPLIQHINQEVRVD
jgi:hypothetical protein